LRFPPWGAAGGHASRITRILLNEGTDNERDLGKLDMVNVNRGDVVTALMSGAGGYGDPFARDPQAVLHDVRRGIVSVDGAGQDYGVAIVDGEIDMQHTEALRAERPAKEAGRFHFGDEREAWESVFDSERMAALDARLSNLPAHERQRRRHALFRALEPRLMTPATERRYDFTELFAEPDAVRERLDALLSEVESDGDQGARRHVP